MPNIKKQTDQFFIERGCYRVASYGPESKRIYAAWYSSSRWGKWTNDAECLGYFKAGEDAQKQAQAEQACKDHYEQQRAAG